MNTAISSLQLADAQRAISAAKCKAEDIGVPYNIAAVDVGGNLLAFARMEGAWLGSIDIAINKAWTARAFDMPTDALADFAQCGKPGFGLNTTNSSRVVIFGGGVPIRLNGVIVGAIGASGGTVDQDVEVAKAAAAAFQEGAPAYGCWP